MAWTDAARLASAQVRAAKSKGTAGRLGLKRGGNAGGRQMTTTLKAGANLTTAARKGQLKVQRKAVIPPKTPGNRANRARATSMVAMPRKGYLHTSKGKGANKRIVGSERVGNTRVMTSRSKLKGWGYTGPTTKTVRTVSGNVRTRSKRVAGRKR